jgi:hypothetical protein
MGLGVLAALGFSASVAAAGPPPSSGSKSGLLPSGQLDPAFEKRAREIAQKIGLPFSWLMAVMYFETGGTFRSDIPNAAGSGAVGLIQFMPSTAKLYGTTPSALAAMSALAQLDFVERHYRGMNFSGRDPRDAYLAVFYPAAMGKSDDWGLPAKVYAQNAGLDRNKDGNITAGEVRATIDGAHAKVVAKGWV